MTARRINIDGNDVVTAATLLADLQRAHDDLVKAMEGLARMTRGDVPQEHRLASARWKLSRASLTRRILWGKILAYLSPRIGGTDCTGLRELQELDIQLLRVSTRHVAKWTTETVCADWPGYCQASHDMRWTMIAGVEAEKRILYPMLRAVAPLKAQMANCTTGAMARPSRPILPSIEPLALNG